MQLGAQEWRDVSFLHWRYAAADVQRLLPAGLAVDTLADDAWVSLVLLRMRVGIPLMTRARPGLRVLEANLRTYVRGPDGTAGIYFFSIDCDRWSVCVAGRSLGVRYVPAALTMARAGHELRYAGKRRGGSASYDVSVVAGDAVELAATDTWLVERYTVFSALGPAVVQVSAAHKPWPLRAATVTSCDESLLAEAGLRAPTSAPDVRYSRGVTDAVLGMPTVFTPKRV